MSLTSGPVRAPFTHGQTLTRIERGDFVITRASHRPAQRLDVHAHEDANVLLVLRGAFTERVSGQTFECPRHALLVRPASEPHANVYGGGGAECLILGVRPRRIADDAVVRRAVAQPFFTLGGQPARVAAQIARELAIADAATPLSVEGLMLELLASLVRSSATPAERALPHWLRRAQELLHASGVEPRSLEAVAREVGVHPAHLTRTFRRFFGASPGEYVRRLRIERACERLSTSAASISEIALDAGFASPSHFATAFRQRVGLTPRSFRAASRTKLGTRKSGSKDESGTPRH